MKSTVSRRSCLATGAALALGAAAPGVAPSACASELDTARLPYIDAHSHVWSPNTNLWPLANNKTKADLKPASFTPEELLALAEPERVGRVVLIQHTVYHDSDNSYLINCYQDAPDRFAVVGIVDDDTPDPGSTLRDLKPFGVRGLRITPRQRGEKWLETPGMEALWRMAAQTGQAMCCLIDAKFLPSVLAMCGKFPQTPVVIDHFARIGVDGTIREADVANLCALAKFPRVAVKLSAYYALGQKQPPYEDLIPLIRRVLDAFGVERAMWASDAPYQVEAPHTYRASIALVRDTLGGLSAGDKSWLLTKSAERVFFP